MNEALRNEEVSIRALVGCEFSGTVRRALRSRGIDAWSCDLLRAADNDPHHYQCNVLELLNEGWDLAIFHPPCTYLTSSGLHWNKRRPERALKTADALRFVRRLLEAEIPHKALENPQGCIGTQIRPCDQWIQPYEFGADASKKTGLWLDNLPPLIKDPAQRIQGRRVVCGGKATERWANQTDSAQNRLAPSEDRWAKRSLTYPGIAAAFAQQWGDYVVANKLRAAA